MTNLRMKSGEAFLNHVYIMFKGVVFEDLIVGRSSN